MSKRAYHRTAIAFFVELPPVGLRRNRQYRSGAALTRLKNQYSEAVWIAGWEAARAVVRPWEKAALHLEWRHYRCGPDRDNALASCKVLIDTLTTKGRRPLALIVDDTPDRLSITIDVQKVRGKEHEGVFVRIEEAP